MEANEIMNNLYKYCIDNIENDYRKLYEHKEWAKNNDKYSHAIVNFYQKLSDQEKKLFFILVKNISIDTLTSVFAIFDGEAYSDIKGEYKLIDDMGNKYQFLHDYFLETVEINNTGN